MSQRAHEAAEVPRPFGHEMAERLTTTNNIPDRPSLEGLEEKWSARWEQEQIYRFHPPGDRASVFSIDTPPPTVSGSLHIGHAFSYTHTDIVARFQRMNGKKVFYPMGWDDNGLPTERRVQNYFGVRCEPSLPYDPEFPVPPQAGSSDRPVAVSRRNFVALCDELTRRDERVFEEVWRYLGLSVDWSMTYATISRPTQRVSQLSFLRLLERDEAYQIEAPTMWDVGFRTAVAQAELEDREHAGAWHRIRFHGQDGPVAIETTRPELLPACVGLVVHPDDERYRDLLAHGSVVTPVFGVTVPVLGHPAVERAVGSGIAMCCTFGDLTDVQWWRELSLPNRTIIGRDGRLLPDPPPGLDGEAGTKAYSRLAGMTVHSARERTVEMLRESGDLDGEPRRTVRPVKFYEKGDKPLEIVSSRQWFIRTVEHRQALLDRGAELQWHPAYMKARFDDWVRGLNSDWLVSRQRFFGVPFPLWYRLDDHGEPSYEDVILAPEDALPVDPTSDCPPGHTENERGQPGGFTAEVDVMDTWATSSLTPAVVSGWAEDNELYAQVYPMDLRPQAHDIIRTWLFSTVIRAELETHRLPWAHAAISGWILDPDRKKMSKSKGNVVTPMSLLQEFGSDAVRYWAACGRPGTDTAFDQGKIKIGRRLATKILNASRFILGFPAPAADAAVGEAIDRAVLAQLDDVVRQATDALERFEYTDALERTERYFWFFCDDYLELVKDRAYGSAGEQAADSARAALRTALSVLLRLLAPFVPYSTEEAWSWWHTTSVHSSPWPRHEGHDGDVAMTALATTVIGAVRRAKSTAKLSMRAPVELVHLRGDGAQLDSLRAVQGDLMAAGKVQNVTFEAVEGNDLNIQVSLE